MFKSLATILDEPANTSYEIPGYKTGFRSLDYILGGISASDLVLLAAKSGNSGNIMMVNLAVGISRRYRVLLVNTTKNASDTAKVLKSFLLPADGIPGNDDDELNELNRLANNIFIEDNARFLEELDESIEAFRNKYQDEAIVLIDDLGGMFLSKVIRTSSRNQEEREISVNLKMLTLKYNMPVLILARGKSHQSSKEKQPPALSDLEHLLTLNSPFSKIIGVHRPEYYNILVDDKGDSTEDKLFLHILQNNTGTRGIIPLNICESNRFLLKDETQSHFE